MHVKTFFQILDLINRSFSTLYGWIIAFIMFIINILRPDWFAFSVVGIAILCDLIWGVAVSIKLKKFTLSKFLRVTVFKVNSYGFCLLIVVLIEKLLHEDGLIAVKLAAAIAAACEFWSMSASMLIINPDFPFVKLFRRQLKGEIASKTGRNVDDIFKE